MNRIGSLNRRLQVHRAEAVDDGFAQTDGPLKAIGAAVPASLQDVSDAERMRAMQAGAIITTRFVVRSTAFTRAIRHSDRLTCEHRTYNIRAIKQLGRRDYLEITAEALVD